MRQVLPFPRPSVHLTSTPISLTTERATRSACSLFFFLVCLLFVLSCSDYFTQSATRSGWCWYDGRRQLNTRSVSAGRGSLAVFLTVLFFHHFPALLRPLSSCFPWAERATFQTLSVRSLIISSPVLPPVARKRKESEKSTRKVSCLCECVCVWEKGDLLLYLCGCLCECRV